MDSGGRLELFLINSFTSNEIRVESSETFNDNAWHYVGFAYDGSSNASGVDMSIDGVASTRNIIDDTLSLTMLNNEAPRIGASGFSADFWIDELAFVSVWNVEIPITHLLAISHGVPAFIINNGSDVLHAPLYGVHSPEIDEAGGNNTGTLTNTTKFAGNPPVELLENYL